MSELSDLYREARFGKAAVAKPWFSSEQLIANPKLKRIRDALEASLRAETKYRDEASEAFEWAQTLANKRPGALGRGKEFLAAATGFSDLPRVGTGTIAASALAGGYAGETIQNLMTNKLDPTQLRQLIGGTPGLAGTTDTLVGQAGTALHAAQSRARTKLPIFGRFAEGGAALRSAASQLVQTTLGQRPSSLARASSFVGQHGGAIAGSLIPIAIATYLNKKRTERLREVGGMAGISSIGAGRSRLQTADMLRRWREMQLKRLGAFTQAPGAAPSTQPGTIPNLPEEVPYEPFGSYKGNVDVNKLLRPKVL